MLKEGKLLSMISNTVVKTIGLDYFIQPILALDRISLHNAFFEENSLQDWCLDDITERDLKLSDEIISQLDCWRKTYEEQSESTAKKIPTPEELAIIEDFKKRGLI